MTDLTRDDVLAALGPVDDAFVVDLLATGATAGEFLRARAWLANDEPLINEGEPLASGRVAAVISLLESLEAGADEEPDAPAGPTAA